MSARPAGAAAVEVADTTRRGLPLFVAGEPLRGIAATAILAYHLAFFTPGEGPRGLPLDFGIGFDLASRAAQQLVIGLPIFFVLSGYLISRPFVLALIDGRALPASGRYLRRRALRILPAFWALVVVTILTFGLSGSSGREVLAVFALMQPHDPSPLSELVGHAWSLHVEAVFYLGVPVVAILLALGFTRAGGLGRQGRARVIGAVVLALGAWSGIVVATGRLEPDHDIGARFYAFVPGIALALYEPWSERLRGNRLAARAALPLALAGAAAIAAIVLGTPQSRFVYQLLTTFAAGAIVAAPLLHQWATGAGPRLLDTPVMRWLGSRSYSIYLVHVPLMAWLLPRLADDGATVRERWPAMLACAAASLLAAELSYRLVERPFLARRHTPHPAETGAAPAPR